MSSTVYDEGDLRFEFNENWRVCNWDDHAAYREGFQKLQNVRALEFIGIHVGDPWLIEAKDYRGHRRAGRQARSTGELARAIAEKVRDSIAGILWACLRENVDAGDFPPIVKELVNRSKKLPLVVWIEEDKPLAPVEASTLAKQTERELRPWLNATVLVVNMALAKTNPIPGLTVSSLI